MKTIFSDEYLNTARLAASERYGKPFLLEQNVVQRIKPKSAFLLEMEARQSASVIQIKRKARK